MVYQYKPSGVCSKLMIIDVDDDGVIRNVQVVGGCDGNLKGICSLVKNQKVEDVAQKLRGIDCRGKGTSCPDQMSRALDQIIEEQKKK